MNILSLDVGTTSMRGILYGEAGNALRAETVQTPQICRDGTYEQTPSAYTEAACAICRAIASEYAVDALSLTAFRSAPTLVDRAGNALCNFIMWQDTRNAAICRRLKPQDNWVYERTGAAINTVFTASKLAWLRENEPALYDAAYKMMIVPDYILHFITGEFVTDYTYGSRSSLMNIHTLQWDPALCALYGVDTEKLCPLMPQGSVAGQVSEVFSAMTGIPRGVPVVTAGGDQQCGALGLGVLDDSAIEVNSGTGSFIISLTDKPMLTNKSVICNVAAVPGYYTQELNVLASASAVNWVVQAFFPELWGKAPDYDAFNRLAEASPVGANGLFCVPNFAGCGARAWNPEARAGFWGFSLASRRSDLARAIYEGVSVEIAKSIEALPEICRRAETVLVAGGLSKSDIYCRVLCDATGRYLRRGKSAQATALGAFLSAAVTLGVYAAYGEAVQAVRASEGIDDFRPDAGNTAFYRQYAQTTERLAKAADGSGV